MQRLTIRSYDWPALLPQIVFATIGFVPIGCLCLALFHLMPLDASVRGVLPLAAVIALILGLRHPALGRRALIGLAAGVAATASYDAIRLIFVALGGWRDFIPVIGQLAWNDISAAPVWGYLYRWLGNGGAMGLTFALLPWRGMRAGMIYGACICCCLFATLLLSADAQLLLFRLTPTTGLMALAGHLVYGAVLGRLVGQVHPLSEPH